MTEIKMKDANLVGFSIDEDRCRMTFECRKSDCHFVIGGTIGLNVEVSNKKSEYEK